MADADGGDMLKIPGVACVGKAGTGIFKATAEQLGWKRQDKDGPESVVALTGAEIAAAEWQPCCGKGRGLLRLSAKGGAGGGGWRFAGFRPEDLPRLRAHFQKHFGVGLTEQPVAVEGWSWGELAGAGASAGGDRELRLMVNGKLGFEIPLSSLKQVSTAKMDLNLELQEDLGYAPGDHMLAEIRLHIPAGGGSAAEDLCEELQRGLQKRAGTHTAGDALASMSEVTIVAPRGKHDFEFFAEAMRIRGKSQTYIVKYRSIARLFLLQLGAFRPGGAHWALLLGLDPPLRQGQQNHPFLVMLFDDSQVPVDLPEDKLAALNLTKGELHLKYSLFGRLLKEMTQQPIIGTVRSFMEKHPQKENCVGCTHKGQRGSLFLLKKSLLFITKPVIWQRYEDVAMVSFYAGPMRGRTFDFDVHLKSGQKLEFAQIERALLDAVFDFCQEVKLKIDDETEVRGKLQAGMDSKSRRRALELSASEAPAAAAAPAGRRAASSSAAAAARAAPENDADGYDEEADEDFDEEEDDGGSSEDEGSVGLDEPEDEPKSKRPKRSK